MSYCVCNPYQSNSGNQNTATKIESYVKVVGSGMTDEERKKLEGIEEFANNYKLPIATDTVLGGFKVGSGLKISKDGVLSVSSDDDDDDSQIMDGGDSDGESPEDDDVVIWDGGGASGV